MGAMQAAAILLAAGLGTRMRSKLPKALHKLAGRPMLNHLIAACEGVFDRVVVVVGPDMPALERAAAPHATVVQAERLGTGHAALQAAPLLDGFAGDVAVLYADNPLITTATLRRLRAARAEAGLALLAMRPADPARYGRVVQNTSGDVTRIVEYADASEGERAIGLCNAGVLCAHATDLFRWLRAVRNDNRAGEYYLTDLVPLAAADGARVRAVEAPEAELRGINSRAELAGAEAELQARLRVDAMAGGAPLVQPGSAVVGPFARLRPGTDVGPEAHVGNFCELKNTVLGAGAKANHLTYLGDADIGPRSNIGAGTITCNYDGHAKFRTTIGAGVFVGSDVVLVAPVSLGDGAFVAAGSVITSDVGADAMAFGRARQVEKPGAAAAFRALRQNKGKS
jgi:bifunctional UDP-N-acetylglucosamine pyrophosphorylase/glucosamine-1-phosphate N-acetyltransferase